MGKKHLVNKIFENGITSGLFKSLKFVKAFKKEGVEFEGIRRKPGVLVVRYKNGVAHHRIRIGEATTCMYLGAHSSLKTITENGGHDIEFSFNPVPADEIKDLKEKIWMSYLCKSLDNPKFFKSLSSLLTEKTVKAFKQKLVFRPAFSFDEFGTVRSTFLDYIDRTGWYILREEETIIRVGQAIGRLPKRALSYFSEATRRAGELHYDPRAGIKYEVAFIELPLSLFKTFNELEKFVDDFERRLVEVLKPRDNKKLMPKEPKKDTVPLHELTDLASLPEDKLPF